MENNVENIERKLWIDSLRGVAMLLVVYGHCIHECAEYFVFTSPVKMPLFFAISGYLFKTRRGNQTVFYKSLFLKLVLPWLVLGMIFHPSVDQFLNLLSGNKFWFMPCLVFSEIIWFYIHKFSKKDSQVIILGVIVCILGFVLHNIGLLRYAMINTALIVQVFFIMGFIIRKYETLIEKRWKTWIPISATLYVLLGFIVLFCFPNQWIDVHLNNYFNIPICAIMIGVGCMSLFILFKSANICPKWLVYIGQNTLIIYMIHGRLFGVFNRGFEFLNINTLMPLQLIALFKTLFVCIICCAIAYFVNRYLPEIVGKGRIKH